MSRYKILSVNENGGDSDSITAEFFSYGGFNKSTDMIVNVTATRKFTITRTSRSDPKRYPEQKLEFQDIDIDGLIDYLQEVKTYLHEEDMIKKLMGK